MPSMLDSNVLLDIITADPDWLPWSIEQLRWVAKSGPVVINPIIYSELAPAFESQADLDHWLRPQHFRRLPLPYEAAFRASRAFLHYRQRGGSKSAPLPDFYIGAHAETAGFTLVTRDRGRYQTYFPELKLLFPAAR
jgi:predicted nucleic acid-binding protein